MQELELTKDTVDQIAGKVDEDEKALAGSQEQVRYVEDRAAEQSNQLIAIENGVKNEFEQL